MPLTIRISAFLAHSLLGTLTALPQTSTKPPLTITHLTGKFYVFTTWHNLSDGPYPANGGNGIIKRWSCSSPRIGTATVPALSAGDLYYSRPFGLDRQPLPATYAELVTGPQTLKQLFHCSISG
ncbi:MAG TPA: hypothetical protein VG052_14730 [Puia sp.]|nr:hypothetical protein [Puia sp.]